MENQTLSWIILLILGLSFMTCIADGLNVFCPSPVNGRFGESLTLSCDFPPDLFGVYWYEGHGTGEPVIRLQEGQRVGRGLDSGEYNITANGGLLIIDANFSHEQRFHVYVIDKTSKEGSFNITVKIIQGCRASHAVIGQTTTVSCSFKPGFYGIYWYDEDSVEDPFIRLQEGARYGRGFDSGEYNITNNGSLVINQITSAHNYSIYVPNEDGSDVTFYAQLIITDEQSTTPKPDAISHQTESAPHGNTSFLENTTRVSTTTEISNTTTEQSENNQIPTRRMVDGHTTDVKNEIPVDDLDKPNKKPIVHIVVCVSLPIIIILVTIIIALVYVRWLRSNDRASSTGNTGTGYMSVDGGESDGPGSNGNRIDQDIRDEQV